VRQGAFIFIKKEYMGMHLALLEDYANCSSLLGGKGAARSLRP